MVSNTVGSQQLIRFGDDFELEVRVRRLRRGGHVIKLERIPLEILVLLLDHWGETVTRDEIVAKVWGKDVFFDTDNSIRGAVRKIRQVLKDDPEQPQFIQTVTGQGYRFIAPVISPPSEENRADVSAPEQEKERGAEASVGASTDDTPTRTSRARRWLVLGGVAVLALLAGSYVSTRGGGAHATGPKITSLAVLPLKNLSGDPGEQYFVDGLTEEITANLARLGYLRVVSRTSATLYADTH
jgi:DNA-binding winged helix-turn-helix (wHTH) protein